MEEAGDSPGGESPALVEGDETEWDQEGWLRPESDNAQGCEEVKVCTQGLGTPRGGGRRLERGHTVSAICTWRLEY